MGKTERKRKFQDDIQNISKGLDLSMD